MSSKLAIALGVLAAIVAITFWRLKVENTADQRGDQLQVSLPSIDVEKVTTLEVSAPDRTAVVLQKVEEGWRVNSPIDAKASTSALDAAMEKLKELEATGLAASRKENHERLEVTEDKAIHVVAKNGDQVVADLLVGAYRGGNTMVRQPGKDEVATVRGSIRYAFDKDLKDWRDRNINDLDADQIVAVTFEGPKGKVSLVRDGDAFKQGPEDKAIEKFDAQKAKSIISSAAKLTASDFAKEGTTPEASGLGETATVVTLQLASDAGQSQVVVRVGNKVDSNYYLQKDGDEVLYLVSSFVGERLSAGPDDFVAAEKPPAAASGSMPGQMPGQMPGHMLGHAPGQPAPQVVYPDHAQ